MDLRVVLERTDIRLRDLSLTDAEVSRLATGSADTIRNWRRRVEQEEAPGASMTTLEAIAAALKVNVAWLTGSGPQDFTKYQAGRARLIAMYDELPSEAWQESALDTVEGLLRSAKRVAAPATSAAPAPSRRRKAGQQPQ